VGACELPRPSRPDIDSEPSGQPRPFSENECCKRADEQDGVDPAHALDSSQRPKNAFEAAGTVAGVRGLLVLFALAALVAAPQALAGEETMVFQTTAIAMKPYEVVQDALAVPSPLLDGYVVGLSVDVVDQAGRVQTPHDVMLHHAVFVKVLATDWTCSRFVDYENRVQDFRAERFYGTGEEHFALALPRGYGYANRGTDIWGLVYMLMNHRNRSATVRIRYTVRYVTEEALTPVTPVWLDVRNCRADPVFSVPGTGASGSELARTADFVLPEGGRIVAGEGHLHGGGVRLELDNATCETRLFTSVPTWEAPQVHPVMHEPGPSHMSVFGSAAGIPVAAGQTVRLRAVYDNTHPHTRVMGIMMVYLAREPSSGCQAPPTLESDPDSRPGPPPRVHLPLLKQPRGPLARNIRGTWVGDYRFGRQRVSIRRGQTFEWRFLGAERHDVTLANGPEGFASPSQRGGRFSFRFRRPGTYNLYCSLHPTRMTQRVIVR
jgi:plastocyanin